MRRERVEQLHREASDHYMSGEFAEALRRWEQLLEVDPADRQAQEGIRLCRLMTDDRASEEIRAVAAAVTSGKPGRAADPASSPEQLLIDLDLRPFVAPEPGTVVPEAPGIAPQPPSDAPPGPGGVQQKLALAQAHLASGRTTEAARACREVLERYPDHALAREMLARCEGARPDDGMFEDELSILDGAWPPATPGAEEPAIESVPLAVERPARPAGVIVAADESLPRDGTGTDVAESPAALEVARRVHALLEEARDAMAEGLREDALSTLGRVFILDDQNEEALKLLQQLRGDAQGSQHVEDQLNEAAQLYGRGELDEAGEILRRVLEQSPGHGEAEYLLGQVEAALAAREAAVGETAAAAAMQELVAPTEPDGGLPAPDLGAVAAREEPVPDPSVRPTVAAQTRGRPGLAQSPRRRLWLGALGVAAAGLGVGAWWVAPRLSRDGPAPETRRAVASSSGVAADAESAPEPGGAAPGSSPAPTAGSPTDALRESLEAARSLHEQGDYAAAVLAYHKALQLDADNPEARDGLREAGARFRQEQATREQFERVRQSFADGAYANALRLLYRFPAPVDPGRVQRYQVNGWYNLGVQELQAGDPREARQHFDEALAILPADEAARAARDLAVRLLDQPRDHRYYQAVEALALRDLDYPVSAGSAAGR
jgi:tetratricopeptide (TPR) repeat protein